MKRIICIAMVLMLSGIAFADNSARMNELTSETQKLIQQRQQYLQAVENINMEILRIDGALRELKRQDGTQAEIKE